jgi:hypothetical protein
VGLILGWNDAFWIGQPVHVAFTPEDVEAGTPDAEMRSAALAGRADDDREALLRSEREIRVHAETRAAVLTAAIEAIADGECIGDATPSTPRLRRGASRLGTWSRR